MSQKLFFISLKPAKIRYISLIPNTLSFVTGHFDNAEKYAALSKNKKSLAKYITRLFRYCYRHRSDWIRTSGLLVPNQALYQTEPHPDERWYYTTGMSVCQGDLQSFFENVRKFHPASHFGRAHGICRLWRGEKSHAIARAPPHSRDITNPDSFSRKTRYCFSRRHPVYYRQ